MLKKAIWSFVLIAIVGVLTYGAVNRTLAKTADAASRNETTTVAADHEQGSESAGGQGWGRGRAANADDTDNERSGEGYSRRNQATEEQAWQGRGNGRDQNRQVEQDHEAFGEAEAAGQGYGRRNQDATAGEAWQGQGNGQGRNRQIEQNDPGLAEAEHTDMDWQSVQGQVISLTSDEMIVETAAGATILVEGMPWNYAQQAGFVAEPGDTVTVNGFEEDGEFKAGQLRNDASGQVVVLREVSGRPMWAGRGQGQNRN